MIEAAGAQQATQAPSVSASKNFHEHPVVLAFFLWWFQYVPRRVWEITKKVIVKLFDFFSITLLLSTLTQPWKRDDIDSSNLPLDQKVRVWMMNLVSIFIGFTIRSITILIGLFSISFVFLLVSIFLIIFCLLPVFSIFMIYLGIRV